MEKKVTEFLKEKVEFLVRSFVDKPEEVSVVVSTTTTTIIVQIKAFKGDYGKIIGKKGRTIEALKLIVSAIKNTHYNSDLRRVNIEVLDDDIPSFTKVTGVK